MTTEEVFGELREIVAEKQSVFLVYKHTDPEGKVYIGYCCGDLKKRWASGNGYRSCSRFHEAIKTYGPENFTHEIIANGLTCSEALDLEHKLILQYDSTNPEKGYNSMVNKEYENPRHYSVYTLQSPQGKQYVGYTGSAPEKRWRKGTAYKRNFLLWQDIEYFGWESFCTMINAVNLDLFSARNFEYYLIRRYDLTNPEKGYNQNYGGFSAKRRILSDEDNPVMQHGHPNAKAVQCVETGIIYPSAREAARLTGLAHTHISAVAKGQRQTTGGFHWKLVLPDDPGVKPEAF